MSNVVLVGRTGNGKSSTGNSIFGSRDFTPRSSTSQPVEETPTKAVHNNITVVDGSGIGDTGVDLVGGVKRAITNSELALNLCGKIITAFLLVIKYGVRFTNQEKEAVDMIMSLFGEDVFRRWGVVVMTHGDNFEMDMEDEALTFDEWCRDQTGDIKNLLESCKYRCVLFNNKTNDAGKKQEQLKTLLDKVSSMNNIPYTAKNFQDALPGREKLMLREEVPMIVKETKSFVEKVRSDMGSIGGNLDVEIGEFEKLVLKVEDRIQQVKYKDMDTKLLQSPLNELSMLRLNIQSKITSAKHERDEEIFRREFNGRKPVPENVQPADYAREQGLFSPRYDKLLLVFLILVLAILFLYFILRVS